MADERIRRQIAFLAAQLMYHRTESEYFTAKRKAAKQLGVEYRFRPGDLPSNSEIRDQIQAMARIHEGPKRLENLQDMRVEALRLMRKLARFRPRLIGSVWTGHVRHGSDIDIHIFSDSQSIVTDTLEEYALPYEVQKKRIVKYGEERVFTHIHIDDRFPYELTLYPEDKVHYVFKSSITGQPIERASIAELEAALKAENPEIDLDFEVERCRGPRRPFRDVPTPAPTPRRGQAEPEVPSRRRRALPQSCRSSNWPARNEGTTRSFSSPRSCTTSARRSTPHDHVLAGLQSLEGMITERTETLIAFHMDAHAYRNGTLGARARSRLQQSEEFEDLMLLRELDSRRPGPRSRRLRTGRGPRLHPEARG